MSLALLLPFSVPDNPSVKPYYEHHRHHKHYVWVVKYAGDPVRVFNSLQEAEHWCWEQIREGRRERWLFEIQRKLK